MEQEYNWKKLFLLHMPSVLIYDTFVMEFRKRYYYSSVPRPIKKLGVQMNHGREEMLSIPVFLEPYKNRNPD